MIGRRALVICGLAALAAAQSEMYMDIPAVDAASLLSSAVAASAPRSNAGPDVSDVRNPAVRRIVSQNITSFESAVDVQKLNGVANANLPLLVAMVQSELGLSDAQRALLEPRLLAVQRQAAGEWAQFKVLFCTSSSARQCRDVTLMAHNNPEEAVSDWVIVSVSTSFTVAPNVMVVRESRSRDGSAFEGARHVVRIVPRDVTESDVRALFEYFTALALRRLAVEFDLPTLAPAEEVSEFVEASAAPEEPECFEACTLQCRPQSQADVLDAVSNVCFDDCSTVCGGAVALATESWSATELAAAVDPFTGAMLAIQGVAKLWQGITALFGVSRSTTIVAYFSGRGFSHFAQRAFVQRHTGMSAEYAPTFIERAPSMYNVPSKYHEAAKLALNLVLFSDSQTWVKYDFLFSMDKGGNAKYFCIMGNRDAATGKTNWLIADIKTTFKLAPDVMVIRRSLSVGVVFSKSSDHVKLIPRSLKSEDVEAVMGFFTIVALRQIGNALGLNLQFPKK